jgi:ribonuclease BN (tRNA processing enzyme)
MTTELVLLGTAGAPLPVAGRGGISSALVVDGRVFVIDCGRGTPSAFVEAGLGFSRLEAVFLTHLHADHTGDLPGLLLYPWGIRVGDNGPLAPIRVYGPSRPAAVPAGDALFHRETTIHPERPVPGAADLVQSILAGYAYHLNVMPLDARSRTRARWSAASTSPSRPGRRAAPRLRSSSSATASSGSPPSRSPTVTPFRRWRIVSTPRTAPWCSPATPP